MASIIAVSGGRILLEGDCLPGKPGSNAVLPINAREEDTYRFALEGEEYEAFDVEEGALGLSLPESCRFLELREAYGKIPDTQWKAAAKGTELLHWHRSTRHCACCGTLLRRDTEISKKCPSCSREYFPTLSPCVITLVTRGHGPDEEALLVHAANFRRPFFGLVAGFVETGESLEEAVAREVMEETGLEIEEVSYYGSQSWPFPHQMMIGFTARYKSGELRFADGELTAGGFFRREEIPLIPTPPSIARRMIDAWLHGLL